MLKQNFIAKTKSGIEIEVIAENTIEELVTNFDIKCVPTKEGIVYVVALSRQEAKELVGLDREAMVKLADQAAWKQFEFDCGKERYDIEQALPKSLEEQRQVLVEDEYNLYSAENFPGSKAWNKWNDATKALEAFDRNHPEIKASIKSVDDGFIMTEGGMDL